MTPTRIFGHAPPHRGAKEKTRANIYLPDSRTIWPHLNLQHQPAWASPYSEKAQNAWATYRDNECYSETYSMGEAAERYIFFWECMANITQSRVKELDELLKD
ncbi:DUF1311 domain-containing protein [Trinickia terrae]|uniref:DUF1311 domain-containing protein n=1 Tax=Trinickia terrae TaxID=2571161 RepID=A0A4U1HGW0_9BURK|nr:DUF1311 domain-containing protein [Trinickia terrae]